MHNFVSRAVQSAPSARTMPMAHLIGMALQVYAGSLVSKDQVSTEDVQGVLVFL